VNDSQSQLQRIERILALSRELASATSLNALLHQVVKLAAELTDSETASLFMLDEQANHLRFVAVTSFEKQLINVAVPINRSIAGAAFSSGHPINVSQANSDPRYYPVIEQLTGYQAHTLLAVPLQFRERKIGALEAENKSGGRAFDEQDVDILTTLAAQATIAIENIRALYELRKAREELQQQINEHGRLLESEREQRKNAEALRRAGNALASTLNYSELIDRVLEQVSYLVPNDAANVMMIENEEARIFRGRGYEQFGTAGVLNSTILPLNDLATFRHMRDTGQPVVVPDVTRSNEWVPGGPEHRWIKSYVGAPLFVRGQTIGFLNVNSSTPNAYNQSDADRLLAFAYQAALAIDNARLYDRVQQELEERVRAQEELRRHRDRLEDLVQEQTIELSSALADSEELNKKLAGEIAEREALIKTLRQFSRMVAHDIKNPLSIIAINSQMLLAKLAGATLPDAQQLVKEIYQTASKATHIVDEILIFAGVRQLQVVPQIINSASIISEVEKRLAQLISDSHAQIIKPGSWLPAIGHAPWVEEVWENYISNAIKYGGTPPVIILGSDAVTDSNSNKPMTKFWVQDNGTGIPAESQIKLFTEFERLEQTYVEGQGLGLAIVKQIVEKLGGQVGVECEIGKGSKFFFTLPCS
jgi:signal transduction histidine kinase/tetratricopeptide (TPR) repeat protein